MGSRNRTAFIISHIFFLLSLAAIRTIPYVAEWGSDTFLPPQTRPVRFYIIGLLSAVFLSHFLYLRFCKDSGTELFASGGTTVYFWSATSLVFLFLCSVPAVLSSDLYEYSLRARMISVYGINPYLHVPTEVANDMFFPLLFWKDTPECYGPAWVLTGVIHTLPFRDSLFLTAFLHKFLLLVFLGLSGYVFYRICAELDLKNAGILTAAFLTNPLIIIMTVVDGHNEIAMVFFMLASVYLLLRSKYVLALVLFTAAVQVKFVYLLITPLVILYILFGPGGKTLKRRIGETVIGGVISAALVAVLWIPFGWGAVTAIIDYYRGLGGLFWPDSIPYAVQFLLEKAGVVVSKQAVAGAFSALFVALYLAAVAYFIKRLKTDRQAIFTASSLIILALLLTNYSPFQPWYLLWVLPLILLARFKNGFLLVSFLSYFLIMTFWKRMSVLAIPMMIMYFVVLFSRDACSRKIKALFSLE